MTLFFQPPDDATGTPATTPAKTSGRTLILQFDGGSRGNPGPAGLGVMITGETGERIYELGEFLGHCTSNVAEYNALLRGLAAAIKLKVAKLLVRADSELVVRQLNGVYKVKSPDLKPLFERAKNLIRQIPEVTIAHVYRESNSRADALANQAMDTLRKVEPLGSIDQIAAGKISAAGAPKGTSRSAAPAGGFPAATGRAIDLKVTQAAPRDIETIINLSRLCAYDLSEHSPAPTPAKGLFTLREESFWTAAGVDSFLLTVNSALAGFAALVTDRDAGVYTLDVLFILRKFRRQKAGTFLLRTLLNRYPGPWRVRQPANPAGYAFIEKVLTPYAPSLTEAGGQSSPPEAVYEFNTE